MKKTKEKTVHPIILEIPVGGPVPSMWSEDEVKTDMFKWLDDKHCIYSCINLGGEHRFVMSGPDYFIREWLEIFYIPMTETKLTVNELIEKFDSNGFTELATKNLNKIVKTMEEEKKEETKKVSSRYEKRNSKINK